MTLKFNGLYNIGHWSLGHFLTDSALINCGHISSIFMAKLGNVITGHLKNTGELHMQYKKVSENAVNVYRNISDALEIIAMYLKMKTTRAWRGWSYDCAGYSAPYVTSI